MTTGTTSLDTYVDWLAETGHRVTRIDDHAVWPARFEAAMRALPRRQRQHSLLPLLHAFAVPAEPVSVLAIPTGDFQAAAGTTRSGGVPPVTEDLIRKYAADLTHLGLL